MKSLIIATGIFLIFPLSSTAVPVVPNFGSGSVTSRTESETTQTEIIQSWHYNTGYTFSQSGSNLKVLNGSSLTPTTANTQTQTVNGISSTWTNINLNSKPTMGQHVIGAPTQYTESLIGPGLAEYVHIERETTTKSLTESTSIFRQ